MLQTIQIKLLPGPEDAVLLLQVMETFNEAANWLSALALEGRTFSKFLLQKLYYKEIRARFGLPSQITIRCISRVCEAYKRSNETQPRFHRLASVPYDQRSYSFKGMGRVSLTTLQGRRVIPLVSGEPQKEQLKTKATRQADLVFRDGKWYLMLVTADDPLEQTLDAEDYIGVDLNLNDIAIDSDAETFSNQRVEKIRISNCKRIEALQAAASARARKGARPKAIRRALKRQRRKEYLYCKDVNHIISTRLVAKAKGTNRGFSLVAPGVVRPKTQARKAQRAKVGGWNFAQLRSFIEYKARLNGVHVVTVPRLSAAESGLSAARGIRARAIANKPMVSDSGPSPGTSPILYAGAIGSF